MGCGMRGVGGVRWDAARAERRVRRGGGVEGRWGGGAEGRWGGGAVRRGARRTARRRGG